MKFETLFGKKVFVRLRDDGSFVCTMRYAGIFDRSVIWTAAETAQPAARGFRPLPAGENEIRLIDSPSKS